MPSGRKGHVGRTAADNRFFVAVCSGPCARERDGLTFRSRISRCDLDLYRNGSSQRIKRSDAPAEEASCAGPRVRSQACGSAQHEREDGLTISIVVIL